MPAITYRNKEGKILPGTTTIIGQNLGWSKGALVYWAWNEGREGRNFRDTSAKACDIGTLAHDMVYADAHGKILDTSIFPAEIVDKAETSFIAYLDWKQDNDFEVIAAEQSLVSEIHQYGGTLDLVYLKSKRIILDYKTSKGVYAEHKIQLAAYGELWRENNPGISIDGYALIQLGKEDGSFHYHFWPNLSDAWTAFLALKTLHSLKKTLGG